MDVLPKINPTLASAAILIIFFIVNKLFLTNPKRRGSNTNNNAPEPAGAWPLIGHLHLLWCPEPVFRKLATLADQYGSIFTLKLGYHRALIVSSQELVKECFTTNDKVLATRPNIATGRYLAYNGAAFALSPYGPYWRDIRKLATVELLSNRRLDMLHHFRASEIDTFTRELYSTCSTNMKRWTKVAMHELFEHLTFNINLRMIAGKRFSNQQFEDTNTDAWLFKSAINRAIYLSGVFVLSDAIPWLEWLDFQGHIKAMKRTAAEIDYVLEKWIKEHVDKRIENDKEDDFIDILLKNLHDEQTLTGHSPHDAVKATAMILLLTGSESTSITMTWALSLLLNHPTILKQSQQEIDSKIGRERWVQEYDINNLTYLQAIVKETLRLYPPAPLTGIREAMSDCYVGGYHIPKGTRLLVNIWKLQRDPRVWSDPNEFRPDRFLNEHVEVDVKGQNFEYIPFSSGRRSCPGLTFGLQVVHLTLARVLQGFEFSIEDGPVDMSEGLGVALPKTSPLEVLMKPRLPLCLYEIL